MFNGRCARRLRIRALVFALLLTLAPACHQRTTTGSGSETASPYVTHGAAVGSVSPTSAVLWSRCDREAKLEVGLRREHEGSWQTRDVLVSGAHDFTGTVAFDQLEPAGRYAYRVRCLSTRSRAPGDTAFTGAFTTAPADDDAGAVRFAWGGDLGGQNVCRDRSEGYSIFDRIGALQPQFFVALGDMIYADGRCLPTGLFGNAQLPGPVAPATTLPEFWARWSYNRADPAFMRLLAAVPMFSIWDDHETVDDAGPSHDVLPIVPTQHLLATALQAYLDYQPEIPSANDPTRLYRSARWGRHLEIFVLDLRQYRDSNARPDNREHPKTMLGGRQRAWLMKALRESSATWKVIVSSVPISVPTGDAARGRDGWANFDQQSGFEQELLSLLRFIQREGVTNVVWITTDVHFAAGFRYTPFASESTSTFHEFISGPLNAGVFPKQEFDMTLGTQRLFMYAPAPGHAIANFAEAKRWFNFGVIDIDEAGRLTVRIVNGLGTTVYEQELAPGE